jgi:quercetin dioxygenase-like cupin family protein
MNPYILIPDLAEATTEIPPDSILSRTLFEDEQVKVILFGFAEGQELSEHTASMAAILHFVEGDAHLTLGDQSMDVSAGAWVHMQPQLPHSISARTPVIMLLMLLKAK